MDCKVLAPSVLFDLTCKHKHGDPVKPGKKYIPSVLLSLHFSSRCDFPLLCLCQNRIKKPMCGVIGLSARVPHRVMHPPKKFPGTSVVTLSHFWTSESHKLALNQPNKQKGAILPVTNSRLGVKGGWTPHEDRLIQVLIQHPKLSEVKCTACSHTHLRHMLLICILMIKFSFLCQNRYLKKKRGGRIGRKKRHSGQNILEPISEFRTSFSTLCFNRFWSLYLFIILTPQSESEGELICILISDWSVTRTRACRQHATKVASSAFPGAEAVYDTFLDVADCRT